METTDIFERAYEALATEQKRKQAEDKQHLFELEALSRGLECKALLELRREIPAGNWLAREATASTFKKAVDAYLVGLRRAAVDHKVTFASVCLRVDEMLETKEDSKELKTALFRLLCYEDGETTEIIIDQKKGWNGYSHGLVHRKYKIKHAVALKQALAESKRKRPELYALLPALLDLKEKARKAMAPENKQ